MTTPNPNTNLQTGSLTRPVALQKFCTVRQDSETLCSPLQIEYYVIQTTPETSPAKWHLAHVTWFYETLVLTDLPWLSSCRRCLR